MNVKPRGKPLSSQMRGQCYFQEQSVSCFIDGMLDFHVEIFGMKFCRAKEELRLRIQTADIQHHLSSLTLGINQRERRRKRNGMCHELSEAFEESMQRLKASNTVVPSTPPSDMCE